MPRNIFALSPPDPDFVSPEGSDVTSNRRCLPCVKNDNIITVSQTNYSKYRHVARDRQDEESTDYKVPGTHT